MRLGGGHEGKAPWALAPGTHLTSLMRSLAMLPWSCRYRSEQRSSSGIDSFFTVRNHTWGLGISRSLSSISALASAADASRVWAEGEQARESTAPPAPGAALHPEPGDPSCWPAGLSWSRCAASSFSFFLFHSHSRTRVLILEREEGRQRNL